MRTACGSEFQTDGAENRKTRLEKSVLVHGWTSSWMAGECKVWLQTRSVIRRSGKPECPDFVRHTSSKVGIIGALFENLKRNRLNVG